jgi:pyridoxamine 5'-phosphate oxidase
MRVEYLQRSFDRQDLLAHPVDQFVAWLNEAVESGVNEPNAMTLATVKPDGSPAARIVLLKGIEAGKFTFFTNYESEKGRDIAHESRVALVFCWLELQRQVRIEGTATRLSAEASDDYFNSRPMGSRLGAHASPQSQVIADRGIIEQKFADAAHAFENKNIPRPGYWGGYAVTPQRIEFWQGRASRMHDRFLFSLVNETWKVDRLAP